MTLELITSGHALKLISSTLIWWRKNSQQRPKYCSSCSVSSERCSLNSECHLCRHQRDGELGASGDGELRSDQTLNSHDVNIHHLLHIPENASGGSSDQHLLCCGRGAALHLWETLQVGGDKIHRGASSS